MTRAFTALQDWVPGVAAVRTYRRSWLWSDVRAGAVLTALLVPAGMGYAQAAGLPAYTGLYATIVPMLAYAVFGPSRILVIGPDSSLAPIIAAAIIPLAAGNADRLVGLAGLLALLVGTVLVVGGLLRLGFLTDLLSKPIRLGYLNAIGLLVLVSQIPKLLDIPVVSGTLSAEVGQLVGGITQGRVGPVAAAVGVASLAVILVLRRLWSGRIPGTLVVVVAGPALTWLADLGTRLAVVGPMPRGVPAPSLSGIAWSDIPGLAGAAFGIAFIAFADTAVLSRTLAARRGEAVNGSREMTGLGLANIATGVLGGFPVSGSASRTPVAEAAGARSQLTGIVGALLVGLFMLVAPQLTSFLPEAVLAAVVIVAAGGLIDARSAYRLWRVDRSDAVLSVLTFVGVLITGALWGIVVAIGLSMLALAVHAWRPYRAELGLIEGTRGYHDRSRHPEARRISGLLILRWDAPVFFANSGIFAGWVRRSADLAAREAPPGHPLRTVVLAAEPITDLDTTGMDSLLALDDYLTARGLRLVLAEVKGPIKDVIAKHGQTARFTGRFAPTVGAAVDAHTGVLRSDIVDARGDVAGLPPAGTDDPANPGTDKG